MTQRESEETMTLDQLRDTEEGKQPVPDSFSEDADTDIEKKEDEIATEEKETPGERNSSPEKPDNVDDDADSGKTENPLDNKGKEVQGLETELSKLDKKANDLRKAIEDKRNNVRGLAEEAKKEGVLPSRKLPFKGEAPAETEADPLDDINPVFLESVERVIRAKGYVRKDEIENLTVAEKQQNVANDEFNTFLTEHPEYSEASDPDDALWNKLTSFIPKGFNPENPKEWGDMFRYAHSRVIQASAPHNPPATDRDNARKAQLRAAGSGKGSSGNAPAGKSKAFNQTYFNELVRGGWSEKEARELASE